MMLVVKSVLFLLLLLHIEYIQTVPSSCPDLYSTGNDTEFCYFYKKTPLSWSDAYNQCLTRTLDGILMGISSTAQFDALARLNLDGTTLFWLGANNFASFYDSQWHWLNGIPVDKNVVSWCENSSYEIAIGTQCLAYDSTSHCVTNYPCNTLLPAPCVSIATSGAKSLKNSRLLARATSTDLCWNTSDNKYANWWTYSVLLLNWFTLFCFFLYLCNRFLLDKSTLIITGIFVLISFIMIITFAILWGVQYQDIKQIPLATVILGCLAIVLLILVILISLSDRTRVQRWSSCMVVILAILILESFLMLGLILCIAYCSGYISLASSSLEKDIIASLLASLITATSILLCTALLYLFVENTVPERVQPVKPMSASVAPMVTTHTPVPHHSQTHAHPNTHRVNSTATVKKPEQIARSTSPVDERILQEFYADQPKDMHSYNLEGRQYVVYEGKSLTDVETHRKELVQAMLLQEPQGLREAIDNAKNSFHSTVLNDEIQQAQTLISKLSVH